MRVRSSARADLTISLIALENLLRHAGSLVNPGYFVEIFIQAVNV